MCWEIQQGDTWTLPLTGESQTAIGSRITFIFGIFTRVDNSQQVAPNCNWNLGSWAQVALTAGPWGGFAQIISWTWLHGNIAFDIRNLWMPITVFSQDFIRSPLQKFYCNCLLSSHGTWVVHFVSVLQQSSTWNLAPNRYQERIY